MLRLSLVQSARFTGDEALDYEIGMGIARGVRFPLLGPIVTSGPWRVTPNPPNSCGVRCRSGVTWYRCRSSGGSVQRWSAEPCLGD